MLDDCDFPGLSARGVTVDHGVTLRRCRSLGKVDLLHARLGGRLEVLGCTLRNEGRVALVAELAEIGGDVWLHALFPEQGEPVRCDVIGWVDMSGARIAGTLDCGGLTIENEGAIAFFAFGAQIAGMVNFGLTYERDQLHLGGSPSRDAQRPVELGREPVSCRIRGSVQMFGARIGGSLGFSGAEIEAGGRFAIVAAHADIAGGVFLSSLGPADNGPLTGENVPRRQLRIVGMVSLRHATIGRDVACSGVMLTNIGDDAFTADSAEIAGDLSFGSRLVADDDWLACTVTGGVNLSGAHIGGSFICREATFTNEGGEGLVAHDAAIGRNLQLERFVLEADGLTLAGTRIGGWFQLADSTLTGVVDLRGCSTTVVADDVGLALRDDPALFGAELLGSWAGAEGVAFNGFSYEAFNGVLPWYPRARFAWLRLSLGYTPAAWDQLGRAYLGNGFDEDARLTAIEKERDRIQRGALTGPQRAWRRVLGATIGYGYRPARAGIWALGAIAALAVLVWLGRTNITPADQDHSAFDRWTAIAYAADTFIPVADFDVTSHWDTSGWLRPVTFAFVALGWLLGSIFVAGFTRIVRS